MDRHRSGLLEGSLPVARATVPSYRLRHAQLPVHWWLAYTKTGAATPPAAGGRRKLPPSCTPALPGRPCGWMTMTPLGGGFSR